MCGSRSVSTDARFAASILLLLVVGAACFGPVGPTEPAPTWLRGTVTLPATNSSWTNGACRGTGASQDIYDGAQIVAEDGQGNTIDRQKLQVLLGLPSGGPCVFMFTLGIRRPYKGSYQLVVGTHSPVTYSTADLEQRQWRVVFDYTAAPS
jgi:hypothetical protein